MLVRELHLGLAELDNQEPNRIANLIGFYLDEKAEEKRQLDEVERHSHAR